MPEAPTVTIGITVAAAALETLDVEQWWETVRRAAPFAALPRSAFEATLDLPNEIKAKIQPGLVARVRASLGPIHVVHWNAYARVAGDLLH